MSKISYLHGENLVTVNAWVIFGHGKFLTLAIDRYVSSTYEPWLVGYFTNESLQNVRSSKMSLVKSLSRKYTYPLFIHPTFLVHYGGILDKLA